MSARAIASLRGTLPLKGLRENPQCPETIRVPDDQNRKVAEGTPFGPDDLTGFTDESLHHYEAHFQFPWQGEDSEE